MTRSGQVQWRGNRGAIRALMITALMRREFRVAARLEEEITAAASELDDLFADRP